MGAELVFYYGECFRNSLVKPGVPKRVDEEEADVVVDHEVHDVADDVRWQFQKPILKFNVPLYRTAQVLHAATLQV